MYFTQEQYDRMRMTEQQAKEIEKLYLNNNMKVLKSIIEKLVEKKGVIDSCEDDLRSLGQLVFFQSMFTYDPKREASFKTYLIGNIWRKFKTYGRDKTRKSRCNWEQVWDDENRCYKRDENGNIVKKPVFDISMYSVEKKDGNEKEIWQFFKAKDNVENAVIEKQMPIEEYSDSVKAFLENMSRDAKIVATYILDGYTKEIIIECKGITTEQYNNAIREFGTFENVHILLGGQCNAKN